MDVLHSCPFVASLAAFVVSPPVVPTPVLVDSVFRSRPALYDSPSQDSAHNKTQAKVKDREDDLDLSSRPPMWVACRAGLGLLLLSPAVASPWRPVGPSILYTRFLPVLQVDAKTAKLFEGVVGFIVDSEICNSNQNVEYTWKRCSDTKMTLSDPLSLLPYETAFLFLNPTTPAESSDFRCSRFSTPSQSHSR